MDGREAPDARGSYRDVHPHPDAGAGARQRTPVAGAAAGAPEHQDRVQSQGHQERVQSHGAGAPDQDRPSPAGRAARAVHGPGLPGHDYLVGRDSELAEILALLDDAPASRILAVVGEAGIGKSTLVNAAVRRAGEAGFRVLHVAGSRSEVDLAFAGLHQLLRPVLPDLAGLPERQRSALLGVFGMAEDPAPSGWMLIGLATLTLLSDAAERAPLLVVVDDAQWVDHATLDTLGFVGRRLDSERVRMLIGARGDAPPSAFQQGVPWLCVQPLADGQAGELLDRQPHPPLGRHRAEVLRQAAGNPLALVELARVAAGRDQVGDGWADPSVPLTARIRQVFAADLDHLPDDTRWVLLLAAAADVADVLTVIDADPAGAGVEVLLPAERLGLVRVAGGRIWFRHPLVRSAVYQSAPLADRHAAHRALAEKYRTQSDRRAWHLAAATVRPDESVAAELEATADAARCRSGYAAAARALERAAELSPDRQERARRLNDAAFMAMHTSQLPWVQELAERAARLSDDPVVRALATLRANWGLIATTRHTAAYSAVIPVVEAIADREPTLAAIGLYNAAETTHLSGDMGRRATVLNLLIRTGRTARRLKLAAETDRLWALAAVDPFGSRDRIVSELTRLTRPGTEHGPLELHEIGGAAGFVDETALAVELLETALVKVAGSGSLLPNGSILVDMGWPMIHQGRWTDARMAAAEGLAIAVEGGLEVNGLTARLIDATVLALRGDATAAEKHTGTVLAAIDPSESRLLAVQAWWAVGAAAFGHGDYETAYEHFRALFSADGTPVHYRASYYGLADLAASAARTDRTAEAAGVLDRARAALTGRPSLRLRLLLARCRALLASGDEVERHFQRALADPAGERWPFERAQARLDYGEWLRRRRRAVDARPELSAALATFRRLDARPWADRAASELRAAGVTVGHSEPEAFAELTPQQQQIVRLAARGLTNREIGERLYLSPRTVSSHLYRAFPRLGVTTRAHLRDILPAV